uniref:NADH dehydrogenase subunit 2 n=1 Tax=Cerogria janthinipennis TaxID=1304780 RepID=UPI0021FC2007|nr:NADH dehydrogenase subunit 2 [Cerogria janthinipennis]UYB79030.1 NADH dehydrogenase subunit 2 [Cerogria janthinipennis]
MKFYKMLFFNFLIFGTLLSISSYSWFSMWLGLEINMLSFIPLMSDKGNIFLSESSMKYFIIQSVSSMVVLMSALIMIYCNEFIIPLMNSIILIMNSALLMKLGSAPFHFWFPEVMEGMNWINCLILLSWQKIAPFILIMNNKMNINFLVFIILFCLLISMIMSFNQTSLRKILTFSSINNIAWMLCSIQCSYSIWLIYFLMYSLMMLSLILLFNYLNLNYFNQIFILSSKNFMIKLTLILNFLSLGGLPPFIGFFPKWIVIYNMDLINLEFLSFMMIMFSLVILYVYIRMMFSSFTLMSTEMKLELNFNLQFFIFFNFMFLISLSFMTLLFNLV